MSALAALESASSTEDPAHSLDHTYWLAHCEGYRVDCPGGRVGLVEEVRHAPGDGRLESLAVLAGLLGRRRLIVPIDEVETIVPHAERIFLRSGATLIGSEPSDVSRRNRAHVPRAREEGSGGILVRLLWDSQGEGRP